MSNINSNNIKVFPAVQRTNSPSESRQLSEKNLVGLVNKLLDVDSFIISYDAAPAPNDTMKFNIAGYYFEISDFASSIGDNKYAKLVFDDTTINTDYPELKGDSDGSYLGLEFTETISENDTHWIQLKDDSNNIITSSFKYKATSIEGLKLDNIDGGIY